MQAILLLSQGTLFVITLTIASHKSAAQTDEQRKSSYVTRNSSGSMNKSMDNACIEALPSLSSVCF